MAEITISIAGRPYRMACDDGEEDHLGALAGRLDRKIAELREHFGEVGDQRITVMAALTMVDELGDAEQRLTRLQDDIETLRAIAADRERQISELGDAVALAIDETAIRIERIARTLDGGVTA